MRELRQTVSGYPDTADADRERRRRTHDPLPLRESAGCSPPGELSLCLNLKRLRGREILGLPPGSFGIYGTKDAKMSVGFVPETVCV
jgi:hypothetical protein